MMNKSAGMGKYGINLVEKQIRDKVLHYKFKEHLYLALSSQLVESKI